MVTNEFVVKDLEQCLAHSKCFINYDNDDDFFLKKIDCVFIKYFNKKKKLKDDPKASL